MLIKAISKYLENYSEPEVSLLAPPLGLSFEHALVIPAYAESTAFIERILATWADSADLLVILVINRPSDSTIEDLEAGLKCLDSAKKLLPEIIDIRDRISWRRSTLAKPVFLLVDRCSTLPIPLKQGVGLARKIGCDIALALANKSILQSRWIHTSDADAHLPAAYFEAVFENCAAMIYPYKYRESEPELQQATQIYDARMRDYRDGIARSGSSYAYNPTGSLLVINLLRYAEARGFPKRSGGEDFYLLNKLQKIGGVCHLDGPTIELECRKSNRVPFGTGPAVIKLLGSGKPEDEPIFYHPACFETLKAGWQLMTSTYPDSWATSERMPTEYLAALEKLDLVAAQKHLGPLFAERQDQYQHHLRLWFDAFRTLKTVHYLRDNYYGCISYQEWLGLNAH